MRLFAGLPVPVEIAEELLGLARRVAIPGLRFSRPGNIHLTLYFLGEVSELRVPELRLALERVEFSRFRVEVSGLGTFSGGGVLFAAVERNVALEQLQAGVAAQIAAFAARRDPNSPPLSAFHPHLTLARRRERLRIDPAKLPVFERPLRFCAEQVNLYRSRPGAAGSEYEVLASRRLCKNLS